MTTKKDRDAAHREQVLERMFSLAQEPERGCVKLPPPTTVQDYRGIEAVYRACFRTADTPEAKAVLSFAEKVEAEFRRTGKTSVEFQRSNGRLLTAEDWQIRWCREDEPALESLRLMIDDA